MKPAASPRFVNAFHVAERMGVSYHAALKHMRAVGVYKFGALVRVREDELDMYLEKCRAPVRPACSSAPAAPAGTARSAQRRKTSASVRATRPKRDDDSEYCSNAAEFAKWRPARRRDTAPRRERPAWEMDRHHAEGRLVDESVPTSQGAGQPGHDRSGARVPCGA